MVNTMAVLFDRPGARVQEEILDELIMATCSLTVYKP